MSSKPPSRSAAHDDRLEDALEADRAGKTGGRLGLEAAPWLTRVRMDRLDGEVHQLRLARLSEQHFEASTESSSAP